MDKKFVLPATLVVVVVIAAIAILAFVPLQKGLLVEGILITSEADAFEVFPKFAENNVFLISPQMNERAKSVDHAMFNGTALFLQVLEGSGRDTIQVLRVYDEEGTFVYCLTNYGDVTVSEELSTVECLEYLSPENGTIVFIESPDNSLPQPIIELSENKLVVRPKTNDDISDASFLALKIMFKNSEEIIGRANTILSGLTG